MPFRHVPAMLFGKLAPSPVCGLYEVYRRQRWHDVQRARGFSVRCACLVSCGAGVWGVQANMLNSALFCM